MKLHTDTEKGFFFFLKKEIFVFIFQQQCDQVPKLPDRQIFFVKNSHIWRVNFRPQFLPAKLPATVGKSLILCYFYLFIALFLRFILLYMEHLKTDIL